MDQAALQRVTLARSSGTLCWTACFQSTRVVWRVLDQHRWTWAPWTLETLLVRFLLAGFSVDAGGFSDGFSEGGFSDFTVFVPDSAAATASAPESEISGTSGFFSRRASKAIPAELSSKPATVVEIFTQKRLRTLVLVEFHHSSDMFFPKSPLEIDGKHRDPACGGSIDL